MTVAVDMIVGTELEAVVVKEDKKLAVVLKEWLVNHASSSPTLIALPLE